MKRSILLVIICVLLAGGTYFYMYGVRHGSGVPLGDESNQFGIHSDYTVEEVVRGLEIPWSIAFTSPRRMLVTERPGRLRVIEDGVLKPEPLHTFTEVSTTGEEGLMSVVVDPDYQNNDYIYISVAYMTEQGMWVKVVRFKDHATSLSDETIILDAIPAAKYHSGSRLVFGPDDKLYITTGDAREKQSAQDLQSLAGKILRINSDGSVPNDNPFPNSPVWSYGHRNPQGLAWDANGQLYETEHGPSIIDGPPGGDEFNKIVKGGNYGWPLVSHGKLRDGIEPALNTFTPAEAPASLLYYTGDALPQFRGNFFFGALVGEGIVRLMPSGQKFDAEKIQTIYGRIRDITQGPDGYIYFTTSNQDGRGNPKDGDDKVYRIIPVEPS